MYPETHSSYFLKKQRPIALVYVSIGRFPERYGSLEDEVFNGQDSPPFYIIRLVQAGSRSEYRWETANDTPCEVNWLDPEPDRESSSGYAKYNEELQEINIKYATYRGFHHE
jgi:hypothetical protein